MADKTENATLGVTFLVAGASVAATLGLNFGWAFASGGAALVIVGLVFLFQKEDAS